jgi:hypothetical protein
MRTAFATLGVLVLSLALSAPALALDNGEGTYGKTNDKIITNAGFLLMIFFTALVIVLSVAQHLLGKRKGPK